MAEKHRILYLLGAGASAQAIPPVGGFTKAMVNLANTLNNYQKNQAFNTLKKHINYLREETSKTYSIDTLARKYKLSRDSNSYRILKAVIAFTIEHEFLFTENSYSIQSIDSRYDAFLATLLNEESKKMDQDKVMIATWNYDLQLAQAYHRIFKDELNSPDEINQIEKGLNILRINGSILNEISHKLMNRLNVTNPTPQEKTEYILPNLMEYEENGTSLLGHYDKRDIGRVSFSWEKKPSLKEIKEFNPSRLVVIGYSFPTYNRLIDAEILSYLYAKCKPLVYLQCNGENSSQGNLDAQSKLLGFGKIDKEQIKTVESSAEFYIPFEYDADINFGQEFLTA